jgi:hypothetical protein
MPAGGGVIDVESLSARCTERELQEIVDGFHHRQLKVLLFVTGVGEAISRFVQVLTGGVVLGTRGVENAVAVRFSDQSGTCRELASCLYARQPGSGIALVPGRAPALEIVMSLDGAPSFVRTRATVTDVFVWSTSHVLDVARPLAAEKELEDAWDQVIPAIIFFRSALGEQCWHNPSTGAGIIIDDPLLTRRYGFIDFPPLLASARSNGYHVTLAFIPWNVWRSRRSSVKTFLHHSDCFSVCAHGCDHTDNEFGSADYGMLLRKNFVARARMDRLRHDTGIDWDPLMVCPQEKYSREAMRAFADSRQFIAVVNTSCIPKNLTSSEACAADLLVPVQDSPFGFPVFKRWYWKDVSALLMGLFLGKPAILVEHHDFFRHGPAAAEKFAALVRDKRPGISWQPLYETALRTHIQRQVSGGWREIRFFTDRFRLSHTSDGAGYRFFRRMPDNKRVKRVVVNGQDVPFNRESSFLRFEVRADAPAALDVEVVMEAIKPTTAYSSGVRYQAGVAVRRALSEFRDNVVVRSDIGARTLASVKKWKDQMTE